jgi:2-haloacid dehalogenase
MLLIDEGKRMKLVKREDTIKDEGSINGRKPGIVFDFGGVLFDWDPCYLYHRFFNGDEKAIAHFLKEIGFEEWNLQMDRGRPFTETVAELCAQFPHYAGLIRAYDEHYETSIAGAIQGSVDILWSMKQSGYPLYALSNWSEEKFEIIRPKYAFLDWFDDIILSGKVRLVKPEPEIFSLLLERINRPAEECLFIDDHQENLTQAGRMGFKTHLFESPAQLFSDLHRMGLL